MISVVIVLSFTGWIPKAGGATDARPSDRG
jgi:hypothetical protein